jgi:hypothetical protein
MDIAAEEAPSSADGMLDGFFPGLISQISLLLAEQNESPVQF